MPPAPRNFQIARYRTDTGEGRALPLTGSERWTRDRGPFLRSVGASNNGTGCLVGGYLRVTAQRPSPVPRVDSLGRDGARQTTWKHRRIAAERCCLGDRPGGTDRPTERGRLRVGHALILHQKCGISPHRFDVLPAASVQATMGVRLVLIGLIQ